MKFRILIMLAALLIPAGCSQQKAPKPKSTLDPHAIFNIPMPPENHDADTVPSDWALVSAETLIIVRNTLTGRQDTILRDVDDTTRYGSQGSDTSGQYPVTDDQLDVITMVWQEHYFVISIMSHYLSYDYSFYGDGGVHPTYGGRFGTIDLDLMKEASLDQIIQPDSIANAFLKEPALALNLPEHPPHQLAELVASLNSDNGIAIGTVLHSFALETIDLDSVTVGFGIGHANEAARGNFQEFSITFPRSALLPGFYRR
jgi:hypothetical protein